MSACKICTIKGRNAKTARYDNKSQVCSQCSLAESFVNVTESYCILQGNTPKSCGIDFHEWRSLVLKTRMETTDRLMSHP
jgi:hypothetical protein